MKSEELVDGIISNTTVTYPVTVDLPTALQNVDEKVSLSTFIESIEYIPLKLKDNLLGEDLVYCVYDEKSEKIILSDLGRVIVVDKQGNFRNKIGNKGGGPGEYTYISTISIDPEKENVYLHDSKAKIVRKYTYDGKFQGKVCRYDNFLIKGVYWANNYFLSQCDTYSSRMVKLLDSYFGYALIDTSGNFIDKTLNLSTQIKDITTEEYVGFIFGFGYSVNFCKDVALFLEAGLADTVYTV
ncbi:6-bladed beta-propeller, partial [Parabacteroides sp. AM08-6]|uniref:6-bladed beta-propeller n=1 Tax=Parabacteroides sp. AM08-6 TaxID=2292053 RepID=UPI0013141A4C